MRNRYYMVHLLSFVLSRSKNERSYCENDVLMNKLVEVELDGQAAAKQAAALRDVIRRLREVSNDITI